MLWGHFSCIRAGHHFRCCRSLLHKGRVGGDTLGPVASPLDQGHDMDPTLALWGSMMPEYRASAGPSDRTPEEFTFMGVKGVVGAGSASSL